MTTFFCDDFCDDWLLWVYNRHEHMNTLPPFLIQNSNGWIVRCQLCNAGPFTDRNTASKHIKGRNHKYHLALLNSAASKHFKKSTMLNRVQLSITLQERINKLGIERWRWHVNDLLLNYVSVQDKNEWNSKKRSILITLRKYEQMERLSLLELAIWKCNCVSYELTTYTTTTASTTTTTTTTTKNNDKNISIFETMQDIEDYGVLDKTFNPSKFRKNRLVTSGTTIIISNVIPFLGSPVF